MTHTPPFTVSAEAISRIADIAALTERFAIRMEQADALSLRRVNKIRTIRASLAIEGNTLSEDQVTAIFEGKHAITRSTQNANCGVFIDFMLDEIHKTLLKHKGESLDATHQVTQQVTQQVRRLVSICENEMSRSELMSAIGISDRVSFSANYLSPALDADLIEMTQPDSPRSPTQKYRLTDKGRQFLSSKTKRK